MSFLRPTLGPVAFVVAATLGCGSLERPIDTEHTVMVIVSARDMYPGVTVEAEDLYAVEIPPQLLPDGVFLSPEHVVGRVPRHRILANEFVQARRFADPETGIGLQAIIPRSMRAVVVPGGGIAAMPGQYVDLWTQEGSPCTLAQAVFVLAVNQASQRSRSEARVPSPAHSLGLLVAPEEMAPILSAAHGPGLRVTVRADDDTTKHPESQCSP